MFGFRLFSLLDMKLYLCKILCINFVLCIFLIAPIWNMNKYAKKCAYFGNSFPSVLWQIHSLSVLLLRKFTIYFLIGQQKNAISHFFLSFYQKNVEAAQKGYFRNSLPQLFPTFA